MKKPQEWMFYALKLAKLARTAGEVPIGAVLVLDDKIIGEGFNQPILTNDPTAHAEIVALRCASKKMQNYRLPGSILYVTLEPCAMCFSAIKHARVDELIFAAADPKKRIGYSNHVVKAEGGVLEQACGDLLRDFFKNKR